MIKEIIKKQLSGCIVTDYKGVKLYTPDGKANYNALWTRDFAYMAIYAGELIPWEDMIACCQTLIDGAREDGWIPDRVYADGKPFYTAGFNFPAEPNLDNGQFLILAVDACLAYLPSEKERKELFIKWFPALKKGIDCLPKAENGLIYNPPEKPHSPYGFTDCICKTGHLAMESLLLWQALKTLENLCKAYCLDSKEFESQINKIERNLFCVLGSNQGMLFAADKDCRQIDVWASCYAVSIDFPLEVEIKTKISEWIYQNYEGIVSHGQLRHLPKDEYWEKFIAFVAPGTYQNGAYWATATGWLIDTLNLTNKPLAEKTLQDILDYFENYGVYECINGEYRQLADYVVSATNINKAFFVKN